MDKNLFGFIMVFAIIALLLSCKTNNQLSQPHESKTDKDQIKYQSTTTKTSPKQTISIHLAVGRFDPLSEDAPTGIFDELMYEKNEIGYYILQFKGPVLQHWKDEVITAGATFFDYIPQFAFLVKMSTQIYKTVQGIDSVRWIGIYQPAYRIAPDLRAPILKKQNRPVDVIITVFRGENVPAIASKIERLGGEILHVSDSKKKLRLRISINKIPSLSRLNGVKFIERMPEFKLSPGIKKKGGG